MAVDSFHQTFRKFIVLAGIGLTLAQLGFSATLQLGPRMLDELRLHGLGPWLLRAVLLGELESMASRSVIGSLSFAVTEVPALISGYRSL